MQRSESYEPTPRFVYDGDVHPITGDRVVRQDVEGYRAAYRTIARCNPRHPALNNKELWPNVDERPS